MDRTGSSPEELYRPVQIPRKGEYAAWALAAFGSLSWFLLMQTGSQVLVALKVMTLLIVFSAVLISLSNWSDRHTRLVLDELGISYSSGLRRLRLKWGEINQVEVASTYWGKRVRVIGTEAFFEFRTVAEVSFQGRLRARMGFEQGELILKRIVALAQLRKVATPDPRRITFTKDGLSSG